MGSSARDWEALEDMFQKTASMEPPLVQEKTSYGVDAPTAVKGMTPGMIGPPAVKPAAAAAKARAKKKAEADPNEIWAADEVGDAGDVEDVDDGRAQPEYEIVFRQNTTPEDYFLGVDPVRHPGLSCADALILKVTLPETKHADIDLDVRSTFVRLGAPKYKLKVHLGETVDENKGSAKWDGEKGLLTVTLPIVHDWDTKLTTSSANEID